MKKQVKRIRAIQFRHDVAKERKMMPEPNALLARAERFPQAPVSLCASDYGETIHALRAKGYTWKECGQWVRAHGADFTDQALHAGYQTWWRNSPHQQEQNRIRREAEEQRRLSQEKRNSVVTALFRQGKTATPEEIDAAVRRMAA